MKGFRIFSIILCMVMGLTGCTKLPTAEPLTKSGVFFDTVISISLYDNKKESILDDCMDLCKTYEDKFSKTITTSEVSKINRAGGTPVEVSEDTIELLQKGLYYSELSQGSFDITIAPLSDLWNFKENKGTIPSKDAIAEALSHVDYQNVVISGSTVTLKDEKAALDLGGIAKGYIADRLKDYLQDQGVTRALINLGGNVLALGDKPDGSNYEIGIQKPFDEQNKPITSVGVNDRSVVSSGVYERFFRVEEKLYHHILDPRTGYPYENNLLGVTIISDKSVDGDGLSTTCYALGLSKGMDLIHSLPGTEAIFITDDYKLHYSDGLKEHAQN